MPLQLLAKRFYRPFASPKIIDAVRTIRLRLRKAAEERLGTAKVDKKTAGYSWDEAIGHLKAFEAEASNKSKSIVLNVKCNLSPEQ